VVSPLQLRETLNLLRGIGSKVSLVLIRIGKQLHALKVGLQSLSLHQPPPRHVRRLIRARFQVRKGLPCIFLLLVKLMLVLQQAAINSEHGLLLVREHEPLEPILLANQLSLFANITSNVRGFTRLAYPLTNHTMACSRLICICKPIQRLLGPRSAGTEQ
jgi:hypothetical protein